MKIGTNTVVYFHYRLSEVGGAELENNLSTSPLAYLSGHQNILPALDDALQGLSSGDQKQVVLAPEQAYGPFKEGQTQRVPLKHLVGAPKRILPGSVVHINTAKSPTPARVIKVGKFNVDVDLNHPLAGKTLQFDITITNVREALPEEIAHGHVHGEGGHHH